jgi:glycogen operon protein
MLLGGDEFRRTQRGNNNAYCQDNEISWYDWRLAEKNRELLRFTREMIAFRRRHRVLRRERFFSERDISWFDHRGGRPDWEGPGGILGCLINPEEEGEGEHDGAICLFFNAEDTPIEFVLPPVPQGGKWLLAVDTALSSPQDIREAGREKALFGKTTYPVQDHSLVICVSGCE